jgi:hypothetical protein
VEQKQSLQSQLLNVVAAQVKPVLDLLSKPHVLIRPKLTQHGDTWLAEYHAAKGQGRSPQEACDDFDRRWGEVVEQKPQETVAQPTIAYSDFLMSPGRYD